MFRHLKGLPSFSRSISKGALEGSSNTNLRPPAKIGRPFKDNNLIVSLDPNKFAEKKQQCLFIGNLQRVRPRILLLNPSSTPISTRFSIHCDHSNQPVSTSPSFPPDTKSFLYYFTPPEKPRIAGELRIRIVSSDDPASFESGSDLLLRDGRLWSRPLYFLSKIHISVYEKLREERLVPDDLDTALSTLPSKYPTSCRSQLLYTLNDTFIIDLGSFSTILFVITEQGVATLPLRGQILDGRRNGGTHFRGAYAPYKGSALVRFEKSTLPAHKGTRTVVLRFLKIITPVKCVIPNYDGYICCPKEGELHRRSRMLLKMDNSVWNVNIDKSNNAMIRAFRLLWDV